MAPRFQTENIISGSDDVSYNRGRHSMKFGALFNHYQYYGAQHGVDRGSITFTNLAAFMANTTRHDVFRSERTRRRQRYSIF